MVVQVNDVGMVERSELRIGNWVNIGYDCKVVRIDEFGATLNTHLGIKELLYFHEKDIRPIPLTEEILLKCGFENTDTGLLILLPNGTQLSLIKIRDKYSFGLSGPFGLVQPLFIQYLHQLQNLYFALTGTELEIKL